MGKPLHVLIVEDSENDADLLLYELRRQGYEPVFERVETREALAAALDRGGWEMIISDFHLPRLTALETLAIVGLRGVDVPFIVVSGTVGEETAVDAVKQGAHDYLMKGNLKRLGAAVERELRQAQARREHRRVEEALRKSEEQLRQSQKVEAIGQLAGGVAHDFNNLLTVINGHAELVLARLHKEDPVRKDLGDILKAGQRAAALTRQLLAFSRRQVLEPKVLDLNAVLSDMEKMLRRLIGEDIELRVVGARDLQRVKADPGQLEQVVMNLAVNARDAMPHGGKLTLETANVHLDEDYASRHVSVRPGPHVLLAVTDTGCGMDRETLSHLFEPFFTTKKSGKGTGLGLSMVYGIVKQSGGNIWVYSEPGRGTTFKIYLPRAEGAVEAATREKRPAATGGTETVLLAEDEKGVRNIARQILERRGYRVIEAQNGSEALRLCRESKDPIHLVVTDVIMPQMGGRELARHLISMRPDLKVLYTSGYTDNAIVHHGILEDGLAFLQKPYTPEGLARKVREVLDGSAGSQA